MRIKMKKIIVLIFSILIFMNAHAQQKVYSDPQDKVIFNRYAEYIKTKKNQPLEKVIIETAKFFLSVPYVANTLEIEPEGVVVNLRGLDCTTFVETVYALSHTAKSDDLSFENFTRHLMRIRYRGDVISDYSDRLHYTSDWVFENEKKGIVKSIVHTPAWEPIKHKFFVMSTNHEKYKQLKGNPALTEKIKAVETELSGRDHFYLPTEKIEQNKNLIKSGDVVAFVTTKIPGIDMTHMGIIYKEGGMLTFIHASSSHKKVVLNREPLAVYTKGTGRNAGVIIARPQQ